MTKKAVQTLSEQLAIAALKPFEARFKGNLKGINDAHDQFEELFCQLRDEGEEGVAALKRLTQHENVGVRVNTAARFLWIDLPYAMEVLEKASENWDKHPVGTIERAARGNADTIYSFIARRGEPMGSDPYIRWKAKQQAKEQK